MGAGPPQAVQGAGAHDCAKGLELAGLLAEDALDQALQAGLTGFEPCPACDPQVARLLGPAQARLLAAWAARERYQRRQARLQGQVEVRAARANRGTAAAASGPAGGPALPPAAAAALARAKARAQETPST